MNNIDHSFDKVYRELRQQVLALGLRLTGRSDEAEDVMQETFLLVHRYLPRFRGEAKVSTWVYRIATRVALGVCATEDNSGWRVNLASGHDS